MGKGNNYSNDLLRKAMQENAQRILGKSGAANWTLSQEGERAVDKRNTEGTSRSAENGATEREDKGELDETPDLDLLKRKRGQQNLEQRKKLLNRLLRLFAIQMVCMNIVVAFVIFASYMKWGCFREMDDTILSTLTQFMTFYISAVLAELLAAIVYIVHKVFSE